MASFSFSASPIIARWRRSASRHRPTLAACERISMASLSGGLCRVRLTAVAKAMAVRRSFARRRKPDTTRSGEVTAWPGLKWAVTDEVGEPIMRRIQQVVRAAAGLVVVAGAGAVMASDQTAWKR